MRHCKTLQYAVKVPYNALSAFLNARQCTALAVIIFYKFLATDYLN